MSWLPKQSIVTPVDFSEQSLAAVELALGLVEDTSQLHVIHVLPYISAIEPGVVWSTVEDEPRCRHAETALKKFLADPKYEKVQLHSMIGDPGQEIAEFAEKNGAELIILPSHGRTGLRRLLIGSVAERVVRLAHCPVLVLRS